MLRRSGMTAVAALALTILVTVSAAARARAQAAPPESTGRTGSLIFLDSWNRTVMPISVAELRVAAERRSESMLLAAGRQVARTEDLVALAWHHRVRTGQAVSRRFLAAARSELDVQELVLVQLVVEPTRLVLLARSIDTASGQMRRVWIAEQPIEPTLAGVDAGLEGRGLSWALSRGFDALAETTTPPAPTGEPVVLLPVVTVGCGVIESLMATPALLAGLQQAAAVPVVDPAVVVATLHEGGFDPARIGAAARAYLARAFGVEEVALPEMLAYDVAGGASRRAIREDTDFSVGPRSTVQSFSLTLRRVDLRDGAVSPGGDVHVQHLGRTGWFGHVDDTSLLRRLQQASDSLWNEFRAQLEDS